MIAADIANTFYHLLLNAALDLHVKKIDTQNQRQLLKRVIQSATHKESFFTLQHNEITEENVPDQYRMLFADLRAIKTEQDVDQLVSKIIERDTFRSAFVSLTRFFHDLCGTELSEKAIQDTFYNAMVNDVFDLPFISKQSMENREPFVYIGLSSQAIISQLTKTKTLQSFVLCDRSTLTSSNCPPSFLPAFQALIHMKPFFIDLDPNQIELIRYVATTDPDIIIPPYLMQYHTPKLMKIVSMVTQLAIEISQIPHFKQVIENVIEFCLGLSQVSL